MNTNTINTSQFSSVDQQARLLILDNRKRQHNRKSSMLERTVEEINIK